MDSTYPPTPPPHTSTVPPSPPTAFTGSDVGGPVALLSILLVLGIVASWVARRRSAQS